MVRINNLNNGYYKRLRISDFFSEGENRMVFGERMVLKGYEEFSIVYMGMFIFWVGDIEMFIFWCL